MLRLLEEEWAGLFNWGLPWLHMYLFVLYLPGSVNILTAVVLCWCFPSIFLQNKFRTFQLLQLFLFISFRCPLLHRNSGDTERRYHIRYYKTASCVHETDSKGWSPSPAIDFLFSIKLLDHIQLLVSIKLGIAVLWQNHNKFTINHSDNVWPHCRFLVFAE